MRNYDKCYLSDKDDNETVALLVIVETVDERGECLDEVTLPLPLDGWDTDHYGDCREEHKINTAILKLTYMYLCVKNMCMHYN